MSGYGDWYGGDLDDPAAWREDAWQSIREMQDEWADRQIEIEDAIRMGRPARITKLAELHCGAGGELLPSYGFSRFQAWRDRELPTRATVWRSHDGLLVLSSCVLSQLPGQPDGSNGMQWLLSVSKNGGRCTPEDALRVVEAFAMPTWDEDNHHPGIARHLWCPVDEQFRGVCECKLSETVVADGDYEWTNDEMAPCRGCQLAALVRANGMRRPCPLHPERW